TLNVPLIVGFGEACALAKEDMKEEMEREMKLRDKLRDAILARLDHVYVNGHPTRRLPNNLNVSFEFVEGEGLLMGVPDLAVSSGSACTSASLEPSYVIRALGVNEELAHSSLRFGLGRDTTEEDVDRAVDSIVKAVNRLREMSPLYEMAQKGIDLKTIQWTAGDLK
ncbi:MAG: aminotransferase class V-fold PLP-dependent enzyme, partial [Vicinamibacteria bacterium]